MTDYYIHMQPNEYEATADCGCKLTYVDDGAALTPCPMHANADRMLRALIDVNICLERDEHIDRNTKSGKITTLSYSLVESIRNIINQAQGKSAQ